jgi:hypothetical protein
MNKLTTLLLLLFFASIIFAQDEIIRSQEEDPDLNPRWKSEIPANEALWDIQFNHNLQAIAGGTLGKAGVVYYPGTNSIWVSYWSSAVSNYILNFSPAGVKLDSFLIAGVSGVRSFTFDGTYIYAGNASTTISKIDPVTKTRVSTITSPVVARYVTYDAAQNGLWVADFGTNPTLISMTGTTLATIPYSSLGVTSIYGAAYDNVSAGGPYLWFFAQGAGTGNPQYVHQVSIATGLPTGVQHNVLLDVGVGNADAIAGGLNVAVDMVTGTASLLGVLQGVPDRLFAYELTTLGPPCPVGLPTNPSPADNAVDIPVTGAQATWTNPANAVTNELYFGTNPSNLTMVHSGSLISSFNIPGTLNYFTKYYWKVVEKNDTCGVNGPVWSFRTIQDPSLWFALVDDFSAGTGNWTITNDGGTCVWQIYNSPYPNAYTLPATSSGAVFSADADECGSATTTLTTATLTNALNFSMYGSVHLEFDSDWNALDAEDFCYVDVSNDGGTTWVNYLTYTGTDVRNTHVVLDISTTAALQSNVKVRFKSVQPGYDWWWTIDNVQIIGGSVVPVELASFKADVSGNSVILNWITATETNNNGFEIERSFSGNAYEKVGFVNGNGTSTDLNAYSFTDSKLASGKYLYRLKQVDFDGTFEYSNVIEVEVTGVQAYSLDQNYPNPFNPSTSISFSLPVDSKVSLKVFDILGQEAAVIVNALLNAGSHSYNFNASSLNSGVYFYQIEAQGNDGSSFKTIKKMMLTK